MGWKGLINDPGMDNSFRINDGLRIARKLLWEINELGLAAATEFLDMITPAIHRGFHCLGRYWGAYYREPGAS